MGANKTTTNICWTEVKIEPTKQYRKEKQNICPFFVSYLRCKSLKLTLATKENLSYEGKELTNQI